MKIKVRKVNGEWTIHCPKCAEDYPRQNSPYSPYFKAATFSQAIYLANGIAQDHKEGIV